MALSDLLSRWAARAAELEPYAAPAAEAFRRAAGELEAELRSAEHEALTLGESALASGFSADHLRHLVSSGAIPNAGRRGAPRILRRDLPRKANTTNVSAGPPAAKSVAYDPNVDAIDLSSRRSAHR